MHRRTDAQALTLLTVTFTLLTATACTHAGPPSAWVVDNPAQWTAAKADGTEGFKLATGKAKPTGPKAMFRSVVKQYEQKRSADRITFAQSSAWDNWKPVPNIGPENTHNAPVFLPVADGEYWYFANKRGGGRGYHAFHSTDLKSWTDHGQITHSHWVTTAEYVDGKYYIYYDDPNDEDPHLVIHDDLTDNETRNDVGMVFDDPSHGSDAGILRDADGTFHLVYEDWSPLDASAHSWDSPLAGHADSDDGIHGFEPHEHMPPIDERTRPTGEISTYGHPNGTYEYEIHEPEQDAYGDYTLIRVGGTYYIFCDYDPHNAPMRIGSWSSDSINERFRWEGGIGKGFHPDPTIGFAKGKFYLIVQRAKQDYVSPGPWVGDVEARAGVDTDGDGETDRWTDWQTIEETYSRKQGFARVVERSPAQLDLSDLPAGHGFRFEFRTRQQKNTEARPVLDRVTLSFQ